MNSNATLPRFYGTDADGVYRSPAAGYDPHCIQFAVATYELAGDRLNAEPPGARIVCAWDHADRATIQIVENSGGVIAEVAVWRRNGESIGESAASVASAIYWEWWRSEYTKGRIHE